MFDERIERALLAALDAHAGQLRKGSDAPYAVHPIHVALLLVQLEVSSEVVQAGLLHDVVEDCETWTLARVEAEFGSVVAGLVAELTEDKELPWSDRKEAAVRAVPGLSDGALVIKACDKLHNLQSLATSLRRADDPAQVWGRFRGGREQTIEMAARLVEALEGRLDARLSGALRAALEALRST